VSGRSLLASGRVKLRSLDDIFWSPDRRRLVVRTVSVYIRTCTVPNGRTIRINIRKHATYPLISKAASVLTTLIHRPDGDPTGAIYTPGRCILHPTPQNLTFWPVVSYFLSVFGCISSLLVFLCINLTFQVFF
jgi:hypothetical protein